MNISIREADCSRDKPSLMRFIAALTSFDAQFEFDRRSDSAFPEESLAECEDYFRKLGLTNVVVAVLGANTRGVNAYRAAGDVDYTINFRKLL